MSRRWATLITTWIAAIVGWAVVFIALGDSEEMPHL